MGGRREREAGAGGYVAGLLQWLHHQPNRDPASQIHDWIDPSPRRCERELSGGPDPLRDSISYFPDYSNFWKVVRIPVLYNSRIPPTFSPNGAVIP